jgi:hypothetical protein
MMSDWVLIVLSLSAGALGAAMGWSASDDGLLSKSLYAATGFAILSVLTVQILFGFLPDRPQRPTYDEPGFRPEDPCDLRRFC